MTTGNVTYSNFTLSPSGNQVGLFKTKVWSGQDDLKVRYVRRPKIYIYRELISERVNQKTQHRTVKRKLKKFYVGRERSSSGLDKPSKRGQQDHNYSATLQRWSDEEVTYFAAQSFTRSLVATFGAPTWAPVPLLTANDQIKLVDKLREKLLGSSFDFSVFLGEMHQTVRLIADTAIRVRKSLENLRRGNYVAAVRWLLEGTSRYSRRDHLVDRLYRNDLKGHALTLSSKWLEIQYGWRPLLNDASEAAQFLSQRLTVPFKLKLKVRRKVEIDTKVQTGSVGRFVGDLFSNVPVYGLSTRSHSRTIKATLSEPPAFTIALGGLDPENVAWELTPWSFVVDWFIPIGQYLGARSFASHLEGEFLTTDYLTGTRWVESTSQFFAGKRAFWRSGSVTRTKSTVLDVPFPAFKPLKDVASWEHCANAIALLVQRQKDWKKNPELAVTPNLSAQLPGRQGRWSGRLD